MEIIKKIFLSHKKIIIFSILVIFVFVFLGLKFFKNAKTNHSYQTATVKKGTLISSVDDSGLVSMANRIAVNTSASGIILAVLVKSGNKITQGQTIAMVSLDNTGQQRQAAAYANYLSAQNNLNSAKSQLNTLQVTLFQTNQTFVNDAGTQNPNTGDPKYIEENATWLAAQANYTNQQNVIKADEANVNNTLLSYQNTSSNIIAPANGIISDLTIAQGMQIGGNLNTTLSNGNAVANRIASIKIAGKPIITINLSEMDAVNVQPGQKAIVTFDALPNETFAGKVLGIDTTGMVASGVTTYPATIVLSLPNDKILPNMSASANIITDIKNNVLLAPTSAIQTLNGKSYLRIVKNKKIKRVLVTLGNSSDTKTQILTGVFEGEKVVIGYVSNTNNSSNQTSPFNRTLFGGKLPLKK